MAGGSGREGTFGNEVNDSVRLGGWRGGKWEEVGLHVSRISWGRIGAGMDRGFLDCRQREVLMQGSTATAVVGKLKEEILI